MEYMECFEQSFKEEREREEEDLMNGGREFQRAVVEGTKEDCMDFVQENEIVVFDGW